MAILATIGAKALYLLFLWLISAAGAAWLAERKGYTERVGLTFGLILSVFGLLIVLLLPGRPGSAWKEDGPFPRRRGRWQADPGVADGPSAFDGAASEGPPLVVDRDVFGGPGDGPSEPPATPPDPPASS